MPVRYVAGGGTTVAEPAPSGDSDLSRSVGTAGASMGVRFDTPVVMRVGTQGQSMAHTAASTVPVGTSTQSMAHSQALNSSARTMTVGTAGASGPGRAATGSSTTRVGTAGQGLTVATSAVGTEYATTATETIRSGATAWSNPANATGASNDTASQMFRQSTTGAGASAAADLRVGGFSPSPTPTGHTRSKVEIIVRHNWDSGVGALDTLTYRITLRNAAGTSLGTLKTMTQATASNTVYTNETFDVTSLVTALTDADLAGCQVWCEADVNLAIGGATPQNTHWNVDSVHLRVTYTRTAFS